MKTKEKVLIAWSGGKDCALALHEVLKGGCEVAALLTTITGEYDRVSMHGVRTALLQRQARAVGFPLEKVLISKDGSEADYAARMARVLEKFRRRGIGAVVFGDVSLASVREYREANLAKAGMKGIFPLWGRRADELLRGFIAGGFKAVITCVDSEALDGRFAGREIDQRFVEELPPGVDPAGENGEYHSFVYDGPIFTRQVRFTAGCVVLRENRFYFCDLLPGR